jgi:hypothetical protein
MTNSDQLKGIAMPDSCDVHIKLSRADISSLGLGDQHFWIEAERGDILEIYRELLDANNVVFCARTAAVSTTASSNSVRTANGVCHSRPMSTGYYLLPADREGNIDSAEFETLKEYMELRKLVASKLGLYPCCDFPADRCIRSSVH